jgi:hypothetical protein
MALKYFRSAAKPLLQLVLLVIFFQFFGLPAISRFDARETMSVTSRHQTGGIQAPAITIAPHC